MCFVDNAIRIAINIRMLDIINYLGELFVGVESTRFWNGEYIISEIIKSHKLVMEARWFYML